MSFQLLMLTREGNELPGDPLDRVKVQNAPSCAPDPMRCSILSKFYQPRFALLIIYSLLSASDIALLAHTVCLYTLSFKLEHLGMDCELVMLMTAISIVRTVQYSA